MTKEQIFNMTGEELETRISEIRTEMETEGADLKALAEEVDFIEERRNALKADAEQRAKIAAAVAGGAGVVISGKEERKSLADVLASREYEEAFVNYIKTGNDKEARALLTVLAEDNAGSVPVPTYVQDKIETAWKNSVLVERARQTSVGGLFDVPFEYSATGATKHKEGKAAPAEEQLVLGTVRIDPDYIKKWITVSDKVLALTGREFLNYIYDEIEYRIAEAADNEIVTAITTAPAASSTSAIGVPAITTDLTFSTLFEALAELGDNVTNPVVLMNRKTYFGRILAMTDNTGRPIYNIISENGRPAYYVNGVEVIFNNTLTDSDAAVTMLVGDLDAILVNRPEGAGARFTIDPYSLSEKNLVKIVGKELVGVGIVRPESWVKVTATPKADKDENP